MKVSLLEVKVGYYRSLDVLASALQCCMECTVERRQCTHSTSGRVNRATVAEYRPASANNTHGLELSVLVPTRTRQWEGKKEASYPWQAKCHYQSNIVKSPLIL